MLVGCSGWWCGGRAHGSSPRGVVTSGEDSRSTQFVCQTVEGECPGGTQFLLETVEADGVGTQFPLEAVEVSRRLGTFLGKAPSVYTVPP